MPRRQIREKRELKNFTFPVITFKPFEIQKRTISQNKHLNVNNLGYFMRFVSKMTVSRLKLVIYESQILLTTLYSIFNPLIITSKSRYILLLLRGGVVIFKMSTWTKVVIQMSTFVHEG